MFFLEAALLKEPSFPVDLHTWFGGRGRRPSPCCWNKDAEAWDFCSKSTYFSARQRWRCWKGSSMNRPSLFVGIMMSNCTDDLRDWRSCATFWCTRGSAGGTSCCLLDREDLLCCCFALWDALLKIWGGFFLIVFFFYFSFCLLKVYNLSLFIMIEIFL